MMSVCKFTYENVYNGASWSILTRYLMWGLSYWHPVVVVLTFLNPYAVYLSGSLSWLSRESLRRMFTCVYRRSGLNPKSKKNLQKTAVWKHAVVRGLHSQRPKLALAVPLRLARVPQIARFFKVLNQSVLITLTNLKKTQNFNRF